MCKRKIDVPNLPMSWCYKVFVFIISAQLHNPFPPPPCEINLHNLHMDAKIAMYFRMWDVSEEATAWPKGPHMTWPKNAERQSRQKKKACTARKICVSVLCSNALPIMDRQNPWLELMIGIAISWLLRPCRLISHGGELYKPSSVELMSVLKMLSLIHISEPTRPY